MKKLLLFLLLAIFNYSIQAQINVNGNIYIGNQDAVYIAKNTSIGFDTLYIGDPTGLTHSPFVECEQDVQLYARGGVNVYGEPNKIKMDPSSSLNLFNIEGNNKTFVVNVDPNVQFIQNLKFIDTLDNISNVYLASKEDQIRVENEFNFSNKWSQTVTLKPLENNPLDLYVVSGKMDGKGKSYIVTMDQKTTLSKPVDLGGQTFFVGSGINMDSFFSPIKIVPTDGNPASRVVKVASLSYKPEYGFIEGGEREEYVNNFWYIDAPNITKATVGLQHHPSVEHPEATYGNTIYYYPEDTATIIRYVGSFPNIVGEDSSFSKWETISWGEKEKNTQIANSKNNSGMMVYVEDSFKYMERKDIPNFNVHQYFAKVRYADDKSPLLGNDALGRDPFGSSGHLLIPDYIEVLPQITGGDQITINFKVKNEYRIHAYEIYKNDVDKPDVAPDDNNLVLAGTIDAKAKTNFDSGRYVRSYKFVDNAAALDVVSDFYYQLRPVGGTGRGIKNSSISQAIMTSTKKLTVLGNPISRMQGMIRYRFASADLQYESLRVALVNSAGNVVGVETINTNQTKYYESNAFFSTQNLAAGVYLLVAQATRIDGKVEVFTSRIIVE